MKGGSNARPSYVETAFGQLLYGGWHSWPESEQEVIRQYFMALWTDVLNNRPLDEDMSGAEAESYLCAIGCTGADLDEYLTVWAHGDFEHSQRHFRAAVAWFAESLHGQGPLAAGFWEPPPSEKVRAWFVRQETWSAFGLPRPW